MSTVTHQIAKQFRAVYFGGNWTASNFKEHLDGVTWEQATKKVYTFNTIATLVFHTGYYIKVVKQVIQGGPLNGKDIYSFNHPAVDSPESWNKMLDETWNNAEQFASLIEQFPESRLMETFVDEKYGNYFRNFTGIIEHCHYHLGQIVLIKKILASPS